MKRTLASITSAAALVVATASAGFADESDLTAEQKSKLTPEQLSALEAEPRSGVERIDQGALTHGGDNGAPMSSTQARTWFERGSFLMGTTDTIDWTYGGGSIAQSSAFQTHQFVFPNIARNEGITRYSADSNLHRWRATNVIGAGVVTPWGDVTLYENTYTHYGDVYGDGGWNWEG